MNVRAFAVTMLAAILVVLTLASTAWARRAWVLWGRPKNEPRADWSVVDAFTSKMIGTTAKSACERAAKETASGFAFPIRSIRARRRRGADGRYLTHGAGARRSTRRLGALAHGAQRQRIRADAVAGDAEGCDGDAASARCWRAGRT
jgi:hypothetical protein